MASSLRRQLEYIGRRFRPIAEKDLGEFLGSKKTGETSELLANRGDKPGIVISFDDGLADHYKIAAPLLEEFGFRGWFFIPAALPRMPIREQGDFCEAHGLHLPKDSGDRIAMNCEELIDLDRRGHVVGCHTMNHKRFSGSVDPNLIRQEIDFAQTELGSILGRAPRSFAWVGGEPDTYNPAVQKALEEEGFFFAFTTMSMKIFPDSNPLMLHRTVLDADMPFPLFLAKIKGLSDLSHTLRRKAVETHLMDSQDLGREVRSTKDEA